jgi:hypothetical protein
MRSTAVKNNKRPNETLDGAGDLKKASVKKRGEFTSTVGRGKSIVRDKAPATNLYKDDLVQVHFGDSLIFYSEWEMPTCIVSDGAYGVLGFEGDTSDHIGMPEWYEPHVKAWSQRATPETTLWFWNSEIGWASVHPVLERHGWRYVNANIWDKGIGHIAGNVNTKKIRRFPVVSEVCVQYVFEAREACKNHVRGLAYVAANITSGKSTASLTIRLTRNFLPISLRTFWRASVKSSAAMLRLSGEDAVSRAFWSHSLFSCLASA